METTQSTQALVAYNPTNSSLIYLDRGLSSVLTVNYLNPPKRKVTINLHKLPFYPLRISPYGELVAIGGEEQIVVKNIEDSTDWQFVDIKPRKIVDFKWHPLGEDILAVLSVDNVLRFYDVHINSLRSEKEFMLEMDDWKSKRNPVSFSFVPESSDISLHRFACLILLKNGDIYAITPALPMRFSVDKKILQFERILRIPHNSYFTHEPELRSWFEDLQSCKQNYSNSMPRAYYHINSEFYSRYPASLQGPLNPSDSDSCDEILCLHSANPCIIMVKKTNGNLVFYYTFDDILPIFSSRSSHTQFHKFEEIVVGDETSAVKVVRMLSGNLVYYLYNDIIYEIHLPCITEMRKYYKTKKAPRQIQRQSYIHPIEECKRAVEFDVYSFSHRFRKAVISESDSIRVVDLKMNIQPGQLYKLTEQDFESSAWEGSVEKLQCNIETPRVDVTIEDAVDDAQLLTNVAIVYEKFVDRLVNPLNGRCQFLKHRIEACNNMIQEQKQTNDSFDQSIVNRVKPSMEDLSRKMQEISMNSVKII